MADIFWKGGVDSGRVAYRSKMFKRGGVYSGREYEYIINS